jgi:hypothetical protein
MKTLDQIWEENFDIIAPGTYQGSDCGNQVGGGAEPNEKDPLDTLSDKLNQIANDPALSNAAKQAKLQQALDDFFKPAPKGRGPINDGPDPFYPVPKPGGYRPETPSTDPTQGPIPPGPGIPEPVEIPIDIGGAIDIDIANDGTATVNFRGITPSTAAGIKAALSIAMAAKNAACANNKAGGNGNPTNDPVTPTPVPTTPLVKPAPTPPAVNQPFRPIPPIKIRPPGGVIGGPPVG